MNPVFMELIKEKIETAQDNAKLLILWTVIGEIMMMGVMMMPMKRDILFIRRIKILTIRITNIEMMIEINNTLEEIVKKEKCSI